MKQKNLFFFHTFFLKKIHQNTPPAPPQATPAVAEASGSYLYILLW